MTKLVPTFSRYVTAALVALSVGACSGPPFGRSCTSELLVQLTPEDSRVEVGASFQAMASLWGCGGRERLRDTFTWSSLDPNVAQVIASTGRVTAVGTGETMVNVVGARYGSVGGIRITVIPE
jgi:hypothetical protein